MRPRRLVPTKRERDIARDLNRILRRLRSLASDSDIVRLVMHREISRVVGHWGRVPESYQDDLRNLAGGAAGHRAHPSGGSSRMARYHLKTW